MEKTNKLFKTESWADCVFIFENEKIPAHRLLLSCSSPVFESMFYGSMASTEIHINDIEVEDFKQMLEYVYTENITITSIMNAWSLFYISHKYFLNNLKNICTDYIHFNVTVSTLLLSYEYSQLYNLRQLTNKCWRDILLTTTEVLQGDYHMQATTFCSLLDEDEINLSESDLIEAVLKWVEEECTVQNIEVTKENKLNTLIKNDIFSRLRFASLGKNSGQYLHQLFGENLENASNYVSLLNPNPKLRQRMPFHVKYRFRECYKIERNIMLVEGNEFHCTISASHKLVIYGIAVSPPHQDGFQTAISNVLISIYDESKNLLSKVTDRIKVTSDYEVPHLISFPRGIKFEERTSYIISVKYKFDLHLNKPNELLCFYLSPCINTHANSASLHFDDHLWGGVVRGISFYVL